MMRTTNTKKVKWIFAAAAVLMLVSGCQPAQPSPTTVETQSTAVATTVPLETLLPTFTATPTDAITPMALPTLVLPQPTAPLPTSPVSTTDHISRPSLVQIESPGPGSKIREFLTARVNVYPGDGGNVHLRLTGEDGRLIAERALTYDQWNSGWLSIAEQLFFTPAAASEKALLSAYTMDGYNRVISWTSSEILLLQIGPEEIELPGFHGAPYVVSQPQQGSTLSGGVLHIEGYSHLESAGSTVAELVRQDGSIAASQEISLPMLTGGSEYTSFSLDLGYQVQKRTPVRLILKQVSPEFSGETLEACSLILFLDP
jgi:hypothetical protein